MNEKFVLPNQWVNPVLPRDFENLSLHLVKLVQYGE